MSADFARIKDPDLREHFVYWLFDKDGALLYIGCSYSMEARLKDHRYTKPWGRQIAHVRTSGPYTYAKARELEALAIKTEDPPHNGQAPTNWRRRMDHRRLFNEIAETAMRHGVPAAAAYRQALCAVDSEVSA
jgi:predicted GIY-YIG superfamily endonuclease